jgi:hypothetical protein
VGKTYKDQRKFDRKKRDKEGAIKPVVKRAGKKARVHEALYADEDLFDNEFDYYNDFKE